MHLDVLNSELYTVGVQKKKLYSKLTTSISLLKLL